MRMSSECTKLQYGLPMAMMDDETNNETRTAWRL
jgi:hypothetical protein